MKLKIIKTKGDKILDTPLAKIGDKGLFVKELENSLANGEIDMAVHSSKDLPTTQPEGLTVSTFLVRENPFDVFVSSSAGSIENLPPGAVIGTSSLRRRSQLLRFRPDLSTKDIRGNVDTRLRKLDDGEYDGIILAAAGLIRLGFAERITQIMNADVMVPAVGQGAIGIETREDDSAILSLCERLNHEETANAVVEERAFLRLLEGGCQIPIGCYAWFDGDEFIIKGFIGDIDGEETITRTVRLPKDKFRGSGERLAREMIEEGGGEILEKIR